jgi:hypothetical protein
MVAVYENTRPSSIEHHPMSVRRNVTVLYGEKKLQKTISLPAATTVAITKKAGSDEILNHLRLQAGIPQDISIDQECTDFYPGTVQSQSVISVIVYITDDLLSCSGPYPHTRSGWSDNRRRMAESYARKCPHAIPYRGCTGKQNN